MRFKAALDKDFVSKSNNPIPNLLYVNKLQQASLRLEEDIEIEESIKILLEPGSSLGGARPKANVYDNDNQLWMCKFPSRDDDYDVELFEKVSLDLANLCGINVPEAKLLKLSDKGSTLLVKRFDRNKDERIHYISAVNALGAIDTDNENYSYLDLVSFIKSFCSDCNKELEELYRRIVFNILVSNTDNHLRNHGFCFHHNKLKQSPMFDINPNPYRNYLALGIDAKNNQLDLDYLISCAKLFALDEKKALTIVSEMQRIVANSWKALAIKYNACNKDIEFVEDCFTKGL